MHGIMGLQATRHRLRRPDCSGLPGKKLMSQGGLRPALQLLHRAESTQEPGVVLNPSAASSTSSAFGTSSDTSRVPSQCARTDGACSRASGTHSNVAVIAAQQRHTCSGTSALFEGCADLSRDLLGGPVGVQLVH